MTSPTPEEIEAAAFSFPGLGYEEAEAALTAAVPLIVARIAEDIAQEIESQEYISGAGSYRDALEVASEIAREYAKEASNG